MLFEAIADEWARATAGMPSGSEADARQLVREAPAVTPPERWAKYVQDHSMEVADKWPDLLALGRSELLAGRDVEPVGRLLAAIAHLVPETEAVGNFLIGHARRFHQDGARYFELARVAYRDLGRSGDSVLAGVASTAVRLQTELRGEVTISSLMQEVTRLEAVDLARVERLRPALSRFVHVMGVAHELNSGGPIPTETFPVSEDELTVLRLTMVAALPQPNRTVAIALWLQRLRGLPAGSVEEFEPMVSMLEQVRDYEPCAFLLKAMVDQGDRRPETTISLARTLAGLGRWPEAKAALAARIGARPMPEHVELVQVMVMLCYMENDPDVLVWKDVLLAIGGSLDSISPPPTQMAEAEGQSRKRLLAHYDPVEGRLTIDPKTPPGEIKAHMHAALILGLGPEKGREMLRTLAADDPEVHQQVLDLLPLEAQLAPGAVEHMRAGEDLFQQRRYQEAIAEYEAALDLEPDLAHAELYIGDCYYMQGKYQLAMAHFTESLEIQETPQAWRFLGDCYHHSHDLLEAKRCYEAALRLDSGYGAARDMLRRVDEMLAGGGR